MSPLLKNLMYVLVALTVGVGGYYIYNMDKTTALSDTDSTVLTQEILVSTQLFIERRAILENVQLNTEAFSNPNFKTYRSFREPLIEEPYGSRPNPFVPVGQ